MKHGIFRKCYSDDCGYYPEKRSRNFALITYRKTFTQDEFETLLSRGYRRSDTVYYRPVCHGCSRCIAYRLRVSEFKPDRSLRRTLKKNIDLSEQWANPQITEEKAELYIRYQYSQHHQKPLPGVRRRRFNASEKLETMSRQMYSGRKDNLELTLRRDKKLFAYAIFDVTGNGLSAVYSVYEPSFLESSPGIEVILRGIAKAAELNKEFFYLGLFLPGHAKMDYKKRFQPAQIYDARRQEWLNYSEEAVKRITGES